MNSEKQYTDEEIKRHLFSLFDQLPDDYAELAKLRYDHKWSSACVECNRGMPDGISKALYFGFEWDKTPEEISFWVGVCKVIRKTASEYPAIPASSIRQIYRFKTIRDGFLAGRSPSYISISPDEYQELKEKAEKYNKIMEALK